MSLLLLLLAPAATPAPAAARPGLTWADAESLGRKLETLEKRRAPGPAAKISITQEELNSYLNLTLAPKMPLGLADVYFRMEPDRLSAKAIVDLDQVKGKLPPMGSFNPLSYLGGRVPLELKGRVPNDDGFASIELEDVRLGGLSVPPSLVAQLVASATRSSENPQGFDILAPVRLPYSLKRVRVQTGKASLE
jgi:hypothetical protein